MALLSTTRTYQDGEVLLANDLDAFLDDIEIFLNNTRLNDDNIQNNGINGGTKIINASITGNKLANDAITTIKIADDAVTREKINADVAGDGLGQNINGALEVQVDTSTIEIDSDSLRVKDLGITTAKINDLAVTSVKIATDAVQTAKIQDSAITTAKIGNLQVTGAKIANSTITNTQLAAGAIAANYAATSAGAVGSIALLFRPTQPTTVQYEAGDTFSSSGWFFAEIRAVSGVVQIDSDFAPSGTGPQSVSGTWRALSRSLVGSNVGALVLALRIS